MVSPVKLSGPELPLRLRYFLLLLLRHFRKAGRKLNRTVSHFMKNAKRIRHSFRRFDEIPETVQLCCNLRFPHCITPPLQVLCPSIRRTAGALSSHLRELLHNDVRTPFS